MIKKVFTASFLIIALSAVNVFAQSGKISGMVKDAGTGEGLIGANIVIGGTTMGAATDIEGSYVILNIPPGSYEVKASMVGYSPVTTTAVRVNIDQTTELNFELSDQAFQTGEIVIVAKEPVVKKGVSSSEVNLNIKEVENLPVANIAGAISLQAGIQGDVVRGGDARQTDFMVNGISMRDGRDNSPYMAISFTSVEQVQVTTGGFNAEYGDVRSGLINVVTKEGDKQKYTLSFYGRYSPTGQKHFGSSPNDANAYYMRPFLDDAVAWTGTQNGNWDKFTRSQYPTFNGWNAISEMTLKDSDPANDLTPQAAQELFLFQHRKNLNIVKPDYDVDATVGGPVPVIGRSLGDLRFSASYRRTQEMYIVPLSDDGYRDYNGSLRLTSDLTTGMKLMLQTSFGRIKGTTDNQSGDVGVFRSASGIASSMLGSYGDARLYSDSYWAPTKTDILSVGGKFTHVLSPVTFYEVTVSSFHSEYSTNPGYLRDTSRIYKFGNSYYVDEGPFGYYSDASTGIDGLMRMSQGFSSSRDSSEVTVYKAKADFTSQFDKYNQFKAGIEFQYTDNRTNSATYHDFTKTFRSVNKWNTFPIQGAMYIQDKLEFEMMVANVGLRLDYSDPNSQWWEYSTYDPAFSSKYNDLRNEMLRTRDLNSQLTLSPRIGIAFPITESSKLFFNYGHFRTLPTTSNLSLRRVEYSGNVASIADPEAELEKTISYELGYEQNLLDQYLIRVAGYYKDVSNERRSITYNSKNGEVSYTISEPVQYSDIRGFEATVTKNRGQWIQGFVNYTYMISSSGRFGWGVYNESPSEQRAYELASTWHYQAKPKARPYARLNLDIFSPSDFGPKIGGIFLLGDIRMNILASWQAGSYESWNGSGVTTGVENNLQWLDYYGMDIKISKDFNFGPVGLQFFAQINNVFNIKRLSSNGFVNTEDYQSYLKSLHFSEDIGKDFTYVNVPGDDKLGEYRKNGSAYTPIVAVADLNNIGVNDIYNNTIYYESNSRDYYENTGEGWVKVDKKRIDKILDDKSYIDMPNITYFTFLNPRDIYWGIRFNIAL
jgi:outer membrane receptor protein involved in Fe transport